MSEMKRLDFLYIEENALSGTIPPQIGNLDVIDFLSFDNTCACPKRKCSTLDRLVWLPSSLSVVGAGAEPKV